MATFVQLSEEDPAQCLVELIAHIKFSQPEQKDQKDAELASLSQLASAQKYGEIIERAVLASMDSILSASPADINTVFNISFSFLQQLEPALARKVINQFAAALAKDTNHDLLKIKLLTTLFNLTDSSVRFAVFLSIVKFALATNNSTRLADQLSHVDDWIKEWKLNDEQTAEILALLAKVCHANEKSDLEQKYLYRYFQVVEKAPALLAAAVDSAAAAAVSAIHSPEIIHSDTLLRMAAVRQLQSNAKYSKLYELLGIVVNDNFAAYAKFSGENKDNLSALAVNHDKVSRKMRALTICSLAKQKPELSYDALAKELMCENDAQVEEAVVDAVISGLIDARIEQDRRVVQVQRTTARTFDQNTWKELSQKLKLWKENVTYVKLNIVDRVMNIVVDSQQKA